MNRKKVRWYWMVIAGMVTASVLLNSFNAVLAPPPPPPPGGYPPGYPYAIGPPTPWKVTPPPGKVWYHFEGAWVAVPPPPGGRPVSLERKGLGG